MVTLVFRVQLCLADDTGHSNVSAPRDQVYLKRKRGDTDTGTSGDVVDSIPHSCTLSLPVTRWNFFLQICLSLMTSI